MASLCQWVRPVTPSSRRWSSALRTATSLPSTRSSSVSRILVYGLTLRMLGDPVSTEDVTQDAFIRAWQHFETFRGGSFRSWLFTIAANRARDELCRRA
ncbi:MAG: hypothetical protein EXR68_04875 [Dehalococcoidia bacterium]|nr:hypothetical protein [Dehalococcoidia bacterium]